MRARRVSAKSISRVTPLAVLRRRMPKSVRFLFADCQRQRTVHLQGDHSGPARRGQANNSETVPLEVAAPRIPSWMKQTHQFSGLRVHHFLSCSFPQRAGHTGEREIIECRLAARCPANAYEGIGRKAGTPSISASTARAASSSLSSVRLP